MKVFVFVAFVLAIFHSINAFPRDKKNPADIVKKIIDNFLDALPEKWGVTDVGFVFPTNPFFRGTLNIDEISMSGFKTPNVEKITYDDGTSRIDYELNFKDVIATVDYTLVVDGLFKISHHFSAHVDLSNFDGKGYAVMSHDLKEVKDFNILLNLEKVNCEVVGFLNDDNLSKLISKVVTAFGAPLFDEVAAELAPAASYVIKDFINFMLKIFTEQ